MENKDYTVEILEIIRSNTSPGIMRSRLEDYHANDLAEVFPQLKISERRKICRILDLDMLSDIFEHIDEQAATEYLDEMDIKKAAAILSAMETDAVVDVLQMMPKEKKNLLIELMDDDARKDMAIIASFDEEEIGSRMTTNCIMIRYYYDYTCMETLQGLSASELSSVDGRKWRTIYSDPDNTKREGLDSIVWPEAFERMEQFIQDTGLSQDDLDMNYDDVVEMYKSGKLAMYFGSSAGVKMFQDQGINTTFLPFFQQNGEKWLMTTPYFQIALNRDLTKDETRRQKAMKVLNTMLSEDAQNRIIYDGQDLLSYSQDVDFRLTEYLKDVKPVIEENHMYIRIASNDFFSISRDVVSKMISGEYNAEQAYQSFNSQLLEEKSTSEDIVLDSKKTYSNRFHTSGGNEAYSVMANTLRGIYGTDVLIATGNSFTGNVLKAGYTEKMAGNMIMPNELSAYSSQMSGAELKETVRNFVEGYQGGFIPFNRGSLPVFSGISVEIRETDNGYTLSKVSKNGKQIQDKDTFTVTCLAAPQYMEAYPAEENIVFDGGDTSVEDTWTTYVSDGNAILAEPEDYITLR